jgi:hypothetical protein
MYLCKTSGSLYCNTKALPVSKTEFLERAGSFAYIKRNVEVGFVKFKFRFIGMPIFITNEAQIVLTYHIQKGHKLIPGALK